MADIHDPRALVGKRKRRKDTNPNPLFSQWLAQWREEAKEKGWKSEFIYSKALSSLKKYPLQLSSGKDCKILQNFGDKICKMLDDRLLKHKEEQENATSVADFDTGFNSNSIEKHPCLPPPAKTRQRLPASAKNKTCLSAPVHEISDSSDEEAPAVSSVNSETASHSIRSDCAANVRMKITEMISFNPKTSTQLLRVTSRKVCETADIIDCGDIGDEINGDTDDEDVSIVHHTPPTRNARGFSDDDLTDLPMLPDLNAGECGGDGKVQSLGMRTSSVTHDVDVGGRAVVTESVRVTHSVSDSDEDVAEAIQLAAPPQRAGGRARERQPREYVPAYRSGPYAIIRTLYRHAQDPSFRGFMTKAELCRAAQPLADKSFTVADPGSRYTAWSSVSTLVKKGYLIKESSPAKFRLTDEGLELGHRLEQVEQRGGVDGEHQQRGEGGVGVMVEAADVQASSLRSPPSTDLALKTSFSAKEQTTVKSLPKKAAQKTRLKATPTTSSTAAVISNGAAEEADAAQTHREKDSTTLQPPADCIVLDDLEVHDSDDDDDNDELPELVLPSLASRLKLVTSAAVSSCSVTSPPSSLSAVSTGVTESRRLQHWYVSEGDRLVTRKDQACVNIDENGVSFLVKINYQQLLQSGCQYKLDMTRALGDDFVFAYLGDGDCSEEVQPPAVPQKPCPEPLTTTQALPHPAALQARSSSSAGSTERRPVHAISDSDSDDDQASLEPDILPSIPQPASSRSHAGTAKAKGVGKKVLAGGSKLVAVNNSCEAKSSGSGGSGIAPVASCSAGGTLDEGRTVVTTGVEDFVLWPGTFDVVLCVDNREFYGSQSSSKSLVPDLLKNGVSCELRLLSVGDLLWVARERAPPGPIMMSGQGETTGGGRRELVLNYVVERKRMDDLVSSIVSGRLKEQKFRLKHSGLHEKIILVESYGSMQHFSISEDRIKQAIANSQIIDGFTVKQTGDSRETAAYLTLMTRYLQSYYQDKTLRSCSRDTIKELGIRFDINDTEHMLMPFHHFNQASLKNKPLTVQELFGKQLIQLWGMSAEKAKAIVERYPTPTRLLEAYAGCTQEEKDNLLATVKFGKNLRNLGKSLSRQIAQLYTSKTLT